MTTYNAPLPKDLIAVQELLFNACGLHCTNIIAETESAEYTAYTLTLNGKAIRYRTAKITPTKVGQFVTLWKRSNNDGPIEPFHVNDTLDFAIISVRKDNHSGIFIFPKTVLLAKGVLSDDHKEGKRAIRVYPPWDNAINKQAQKTQQWQQDYFIKIADAKPIEFMKVKALFN